MHMPKKEKHRLWEERIQEFYSSGQTCKAWCREQQIPVATMNYWLRKQKSDKIPCGAETLFAKLPTEDELLQKDFSNIPLPMRIFITECIRIEISSQCPAELLQTLVKALKEHA